MIDFYLPIFPSSTLSHSVITTVWIGIMVIAFFNLRFGWIFTGLVVPGYLTPLLLIKPLSVVIIMGESIITYLLIYLLSEVAAKRGLWTNFFGRDRFFALLLASVVVRLFFDGWALPWFNAYSLSHWHINLDINDSLHSFGLIIVALIANHLWKPKLLSGLFQLFVTIGITYLIVRYFFIAHTNFSLSNIGYLYEDIAGSILASPKSYIILIVTACIASRMNLFYGWEFNGIMVPSLLALQWYQPSKIAISFLEAYVILFLATMILKLPFIRDMSVEGARKVVLFFNIGFFYKIALSLAIVSFFPAFKVSDYFGFGYLLSTLIAIKMYDKISMPMFTRATLQTSLVAIFIATVIGYMLTQLPSQGLFYTEKAKIEEHNLSIESQSHLLAYIEREKVRLYAGNTQKGHLKPTPAELSDFKEALRLIEEDFEGTKSKIIGLLNNLHYEMVLLEKRYLLLRQKEGFEGWGLYVIDTTQTRPLLLEVPYPLESSDVMESAVVLFKQISAQTLALSGVPFDADNEMIANTYNNYYSFYHLFHQQFSHNSVVQVRNLPQSLQKQFNPQSLNEESPALLFIKGYIPTSLNLSSLQKILPSLQVHWDDETPSSLQKETLANGFIELYLSQLSREKIVASSLIFQQSITKEASLISIEGLLQRWLLEKKLDISRKNTNLYVAPTEEELRFFDHVIFSPLLKLLERWRETPISHKNQRSELLALAFSAHSLGYTLTWYEDSYKTENYLILHEAKEDTKRYWGTYIFKIGESRNIMIQTPRPLYEGNTFEYSLELFSQLNAKVLLLSATHPLTNDDGSADIMHFKNKKSLFNLLSQVLFRESMEESMNALQVRGMSQDPLLQSPHAILAFRSVFSGLETLEKEEQFIYNYLNSHIRLGINDGSEENAGYNALGIQALYLEQSQNNSFNTLWLPAFVRTQYRQLLAKSLLHQQFESIGIEVKEENIVSYVSGVKEDNLSFGCDEGAIFDHLLHYLESQDISEIDALNHTKNLKLTLLIDTQNLQPYLLLQNKEELFIGLAKLNAQPPYTTMNLTQSKTFKSSIEYFYYRTFVLLYREPQCEK